MGVLLGVLLLAVLLSGLAAWPLLAYRSAVRVLGMARARIDAYLLMAVPVLITVALAVWWVLTTAFDGRFVVLAAMATAGALASLPTRVVELTGGPRDASSPVETQLHALLTSAQKHDRDGNRAAWRNDLEAAASIWEAEGAAIREAIHALLEAERRGASPREMRARLRALERATAARWAAPRGVRRIADIATVVVLVGTFTFTFASGVTARQACIGSETPSGEPSTAQMDMSETIPKSLLVEPEPGARPLLDLPLTLVEAAETRADPDARADLEEAGFVTGHYRSWTAMDGRVIHADAFEFRSEAGALEYQRRVHRYACEAANLHFDAPEGGVGLQTRYNSGDPIVEQVSWVTGNRRYLVSVRHLDAPADHSRILGIYERAITR
jgi:hypothetical protein